METLAVSTSKELCITLRVEQTLQWVLLLGSGFEISKMCLRGQATLSDDIRVVSAGGQGLNPISDY